MCDCENWKAVAEPVEGTDRQRVTITGLCQCPRTGITPVLTQGNQGINPDSPEFHVELSFKRADLGNEVVTDVEAKETFTMKNTERKIWINNTENDEHWSVEI